MNLFLVKSKVVCPICNEIHKLEKNGFDSLPKNM